MKILVLDIETTNFFNRGGLIVEIGVVELNLDNGNITPKYYSLVKEKSFNETHKNSWIFNNTDLDFNEVNRAKDLNLFELQYLFNRYKVISWNTDFDFTFLKDRGLILQELPCPMKQSTNYFKIPGNYGFKYPSVQEAWNILFPDIEKIETHRALDDTKQEARIIYELYKKDVLKW